MIFSAAVWVHKMDFITAKIIGRKARHSRKSSVGL